MNVHFFFEKPFLLLLLFLKKKKKGRERGEKRKGMFVSYDEINEVVRVKKK